MNRKYRIWILVLGICWILTGKTVRAEEGPAVLVQTQAKGFYLEITENAPDWEHTMFGLSYRKDWEDEAEIIMDLSDVTWEEKEDIFFAEISVETEGIYELLLEVSDMDGNKSELLREMLCLDETAPEIRDFVVTSEEGELACVENMFYGHSKVHVKIPIEDRLSGLQKAAVWTKKEEELICQTTCEWDGKDQTAEAELLLEEPGVWEIGIEMEDAAGNRTEEIEWLGTVMIEDIPPMLHLDVVGPEGMNGFYRGDVTLHLQGKDEESGILRSGMIVNGRELETWVPEGKEETVERQIQLSAKQYEGTVLAVWWAEDLAGNRIEQEYYIKIDAEAPNVELEWRAGQAVNGCYYGKERRAVLKIREMHFDKTNVKIWNGKQLLDTVPFVKGPGEDTYMAELFFSEDGTYDITVECLDQAGNPGNTVKADRFVIDRTRPVIRVQYEDMKEGQNAFSKERKAVITIKEANPDIQGLDLQIELDEVLQETVLPETVFSIKENGMTGVLLFEKEGNYRWSLQAVDLAGNRSNLWESDAFLLDFTIPTLEISGITDGASINTAVSVDVSGTDAHLKEQTLEVSVYRDGIRIAPPGKMKSDGDSEKVCFEEFPMDAAWDGHYRIEAVCEDAAGNRAEESWDFTLNRFGSTLIPGNALLRAMDMYYLNTVPDIHITEKNPDRLSEQILFLRDEEGMRLLTEGADYQVTHSEDAYGWHVYVYQIRQEVFRTDGICELSLHTKDAAGNQLDSRNKTVMEIFLDRKGPEVIFRGLTETKKGQTDDHRIIVQVQGKSPVKEVVFRINGEQTASYGEQEILEAGGIFHLYSGEKKDAQSLVVEASDAAGNRTCTDPLIISGDDRMENEKNEKTGEEERNEVTDQRTETEEIKELKSEPWIVLLAGVVCLFFCIMIVHFIKKAR